jgi:hypothetical protein
LCGPESRKLFRRPVDSLKYRFLDITQVAFWEDQKAEMSSQGHSTHWNMAFSNSDKSLFTTTRKHKISSQTQYIPCNIAFST